MRGCARGCAYVFSYTAALVFCLLPPIMVMAEIVSGLVKVFTTATSVPLLWETRVAEKRTMSHRMTKGLC